VGAHGAPEGPGAKGLEPRGQKGGHKAPLGPGGRIRGRAPVRKKRLGRQARAKSGGPLGRRWGENWWANMGARAPVDREPGPRRWAQGKRPGTRAWENGWRGKGALREHGRKGTSRVFRASRAVPRRSPGRRATQADPWGEEIPQILEEPQIRARPLSVGKLRRNLNVGGFNKGVPLPGC